MARWQNLWDSDEIGRFLYSITPRVCLKPWFHNIPGDRAFIRMMSRLRFNHFALGEHLQRIGLDDSKVCGCGLGFHDMDHFLWSCVEYKSARPALLDAVERLGKCTDNVGYISGIGLGIPEGYIRFL